MLSYIIIESKDERTMMSRPFKELECRYLKRHTFALSPSHNDREAKQRRKRSKSIRFYYLRSPPTEELIKICERSRNSIGPVDNRLPVLFLWLSASPSVHKTRIGMLSSFTHSFKLLVGKRARPPKTSNEATTHKHKHE